ncbi:MAG TPA: DUF6516 family protein [Gammaproteobacteria bacterium]|nr:DUF6516 family protein [Gammaproteobacteria bacterium]
MKNKKRSKKTKSEYLLEDEVYTLHLSKGNGILRRQVWVDNNGEVTRYSLAYINHHLFSGDNGRVLGYDNAHNYHHRHYMGKIESVTFNSFSETEIRFQQEFEVLHEKAPKK